MTEITYYPICPASELPPGERLFIQLGDQVAVVILNVEGAFFAIADRCTHDDGPLGEGEVEDHVITCPRHGAQFDIRTGAVLALPAVKPVPTYPTRVTDGILEIGVEND